VAGFYGLPGNRWVAWRLSFLPEAIEMTIKLKFRFAMPILRGKAKCINFHVGEKTVFQWEKCVILCCSEM